MMETNTYRRSIYEAHLAAPAADPPVKDVALESHWTYDGGYGAMNALYNLFYAEAINGGADPARDSRGARGRPYSTC